MIKMKLFLTLLILNCTLLIGEATAQWWVQGGNLLWPYGDVTINGALKTNSDFYIDSLGFSRNLLIEDGELGEQSLYLDIPNSLTNPTYSRYNFDAFSFSFRLNNTDNAPLFSFANTGSNIGKSTGNSFRFNYSSYPTLGFVYQGLIQANIQVGPGSPEGSMAAKVGSIYLRTDGGAGSTFYVKESGTGNTGWVGK